LIGAKGCNMKRIIEMCIRDNKEKHSQDALKLRLRGRGSGFKEGPSQQESDEPLHLCVSSRFYDKYLLACHLVQELLMSVYEEYRDYCTKTGKDCPDDLSIRKIENVSGRKITSFSVLNSKDTGLFNTSTTLSTSSGNSAGGYFGYTSSPSGSPNSIKNEEETRGKSNSFKCISPTVVTQDHREKSNSYHYPAAKGEHQMYYQRYNEEPERINWAKKGQQWKPHESLQLN